MKSVLPENYTYIITNFKNLPPHRTQETFEVPNFKLDTFVNVDSKEGAREWFATFQSWSKTTMPETRRYKITGRRVIFCETCHCVHSNTIKKKQRNRETKNLQSSQARNIYCTATIHLRLECQRIILNHPLEVNIKCEELLSLFRDGHSPSSALYAYEDQLHLSATNE